MEDYHHSILADMLGDLAHVLTSLQQSNLAQHLDIPIFASLS